MCELKCAGCGSKFVVNKTHLLCDKCNYFRLHGETRQQAQIRKQRERPAKIYQLKRSPLKRASFAYKPSKTLKRQAIKPKRREPTGEWDLFMEIWEEREHRCENCKIPLPEQPIPDFFSHIKSKGACPELKLVKTNIEINCKACHDIYEFGDREDYKKRHNLYL